jgi:glycosyltransferase involved in cell wall biosynthesis
MKILFVCEGLNDRSIVAQPWKHVFEIAKRAKQMGNEIKIITDQSTQTKSSIDNVPLLTVRRSAFSFDPEALSFQIETQNPDIVNWHCSDVWSSFNLWRLRKRANSKIVWTLHSGILSFEDLRNLEPQDYLQLYKFWNNIFNAMIPKRIIQKWLNIDALVHVVTLSNRTAKRLNSLGVPEEMVTCIPSGVDVDVFRSQAPAENFPRILYLGPLSKLRGTDTLLSAYEHVKRRVPSARLTLLARESHHNKTWEKRITKLRDVDLITGVLEQKEIVEKLDSASIVVLPFRFWPQVECPLTVVEAMAMKKPTISTSIGAIPEMISNGKTGFLVSPKNPKELATTIVELLTNKPLCKRIGENARAHVEHSYDWNVITRRTVETLSKALE